MDLATGTVEVYREPHQGNYSQVRIASRGDLLSPAAFPDFSLSVDDILGV